MNALPFYEAEAKKRQQEAGKVFHKGSSKGSKNIFRTFGTDDGRSAVLVGQKLGARTDLKHSKNIFGMLSEGESALWCVIPHVSKKPYKNKS